MNIGPHQAAFLKAIAPEYSEGWTPVNSTQAEALFNENAALFGDHDGVPCMVAFRVFGWKPVMEVFKEASREEIIKAGVVYWNVWSYDGASVSYLTRRGFRRAVTIRNIEAYAAQEIPFNEARSADFDEMDATEDPKQGRR